MRNMLRITISVYSILLALVLSNITASAQQISSFKENDRIVFLGNSITDGGHYHSYIWLYYMTRYPNMNLTILNAGIGGDRAVEMVRRLDGDVFSKNPTMLLTTFGMNDTGYFEYNGDKPKQFADEKVKESFEAFKQMEERYKSLQNVQLVMMGSTPYDEGAVIEGNTAFKNKNKAMLRIVDFQRESALKNGWQFFDFNEPMTNLNVENQKKDKTFTLCGGDRIHPDNDGHMVMAYLFLKAQGQVGSKVADVAIDASNLNILSAENCVVSDLKNTSGKITFDYHANALPYPMDTLARGWGAKKSQYEAVKVVPFIDDMNQELLSIKGLSGEYELMIDDEVVGVWTASDLSSGVNLALESKTPQYQQALKVMHLNEERWEIERRFRDYAWVQHNFFQPKGLLDANNRKAIEVMDAHKDKDGWLNAKRDLYVKAMHPEVRKAWHDQMDMLQKLIYETNKPQKRAISLRKVK